MWKCILCQHCGQEVESFNTDGCPHLPPRRERRQECEVHWTTGHCSVWYTIPVEHLHEALQLLHPAQLCAVDHFCPVGHQRQDRPQLYRVCRQAPVWSVSSNGTSVVHTHSHVYNFQITVGESLIIHRTALTGMASTLFSTRAKNFSGVPMLCPSS